MAEIKYRPSLTGDQIATLLDLCKSVASLTPEVMSCISVLSPFAAKIQVGAITPAYVSSDRPKTVEQRLGMVVSATPEMKRLAAYKKLCSPAARSMSVDELELAHQYRYDHELMDATEALIFESGQHNPHAFLTQPAIDTDSGILDVSPAITPEDL